MAHEHQDGFARPTDVPAYVEVPVVYAAGTDPHVIGDGVGDRGSPMPVLATQLDDIPSTALGWLLASDVSFPPPAEVVDLDAGEAKFRAHANVSHILPDDPIRNFGHPGASHLHTFFGSATINAHSTYASLRNRANERAAAGQVASTATGGPYNGTGYWMPAIMNGPDAVVKPGQIIIYYTANPARRALREQRLPRGLRYVTGFNMDDPDNLIVKAQIAAANAQPGTAGRYAFKTNGFDGWTMYNEAITEVILTTEGEVFSPCIVNLDGSNPWDIGDNEPGYLKAFIHGPVGYDGLNLWSPGGYKHVYHPTLDTTTGQDCLPDGAYWLPELEITPFFRHNGWLDYQNWYLSSDEHASMVAGRTLAPGTSMHTDWFGGWDDSVFGDATGWQAECVGAVEGGSLHSCEASCFRADGTRLLSGDPAPDGSRNPQVTTPEVYDTSDPADMFAVPTGGFTGPVTVPARAA